jgi:hypothetical protein
MRALNFKSALALPVVLAGLAASAQSPTGIVTLSELRNIARPLLIFAPSPDDPQLQIQLRRLHDNAPALSARNIVVIAIPYNSPSPTSAQLTDTAAQSARRRFNIAPTDFSVILIGKDGGEKLRATEPLTLDKLRDTIDAMPMRQQEMRTPPNP